MVKIVGIDNSYIKEVSCKRCASKLEYTRDEVEEKTVSDYSGTSDTHYYIICPSCFHDVYVKI